MNERSLLIMAAVGASVVAYVVYALMSRGMGEQPQPQPQSVGVAGGDVAAPDDPAATRTASQPSSGAKPKLPTARRPATPSGSPPPPLPMPEVSLEEAREDYDDFIAELERELERNKDTGKPLANKHWVDYYSRTHEVMNPLRRYLSTGTENDKQEVSDKDERLRDLMAKLQRDPATLEEDESPVED